MEIRKKELYKYINEENIMSLETLHSKQALKSGAGGEQSHTFHFIFLICPISVREKSQVQEVDIALGIFFSY